jgi:cell wall assembly regulator SMI1
MEPVEIIEQALVEHPGLRLRPPPARDEIDALEVELEVALPRGLRVLLERTGGIDGGPLAPIDFTGGSFDVEVREVFPSGLPIAHDGSGNHWVLDLTPEAASPLVYYLAHDPPVALLQSPDLGHFLTEVFRKLDPAQTSLVDDVHDDRLFHVWREHPGELAYAAAAEGDDELRAFAATLDDRHLIVDLRVPEIGMGLAWGRFGPATEIRRDGYRRLFAYAPPERRPGLLRRLFGRPAS